MNNTCIVFGILAISRIFNRNFTILLMATDNVNILTAFFRFLSFISPCVLPIVPGYISFISGVSIEAMKMRTRKSNAQSDLLRTLFFIAGFSLVFIALGASASGGTVSSE